MSHIAFQTEPRQRALLRWTMRSSGEEPYDRVFTYPIFPHGIAFICFDGNRLHRWEWRKKDLPDVPILGQSWEIPDLGGITGKDIVTLFKDDADPAPVFQFSGLIGKAYNMTTVARVSDGQAFRENALSLVNQIGYGQQKYVVFDLHNGMMSFGDNARTFDVEDVDGVDELYLVDPKFLRDAIPYFVKQKNKTYPLILGMGEKTFILDSGIQTAIIGQKTIIEDEEEEETNGTPTN